VVIVIVTAASVQDRGGAKPALAHLRDWYERITLIGPTAPTPESS
jgi:hypothetical protein